MDRGEPLKHILWAGDEDTLTFRLLCAGTSAQVEACALPVTSGAAAPEIAFPHPAAVKALEDLVAQRPAGCVGIAVPPGLAALRVASLGDGLAKAVGWADSLAFAGGMPGAYGFLARVGGMVAALRERLGERYLHVPAQIDTRGPVAWAALAALTQLRADGVACAPDALTGAVAHRLGVELARASTSNGSGIIFDDDGFTVSFHDLSVQPVRVDNALIELHTVAAQLRLFTSREPDLAAMREVLGA
ncbi:MAG: hypothetical protein QM705_01605 [Ancrocorticia sp.]